MTQRQINISFDYVSKCIDSCCNQLHLESAQSLIDSFFIRTDCIQLTDYLNEKLKMKTESFKPIETY